MNTYRGFGLITSSSFFSPQVNLPGSMASFVLPAAVPLPPPVKPKTGLSGLGLDPSNPCYDPERPSWMPAWLNDSNEQACMQAAQSSVSTAAMLKQAVSPSVIPTITYPTSTSTSAYPGLPVGYDPMTGALENNPTGATVLPAPGQYGADITASLTYPPGGSGAPASSEPWYCQLLGLGCNNPSNSSYTWLWLLAGGAFLAIVVLKKI
jgi:hypothetical protein